MKSVAAVGLLTVLNTPPQVFAAARTISSEDFSAVFPVCAIPKESGRIICNSPF